MRVKEIRKNYWL
nr:envelope glycoprotein [Human immunodeficiency virus 1]AAF75496.1 envelope glycoprotein [Human immunodeficiency virus 1]AAF75497.1 envelope glycoprotein [Human immunodeficiency virus 1]